MRKLLLLTVALFTVSCATIDQTELYGTVEEVLYYNNHHYVKAWCKSKQKYYKIKTDKLYQIGETIRIK